MYKNAKGDFYTSQSSSYVTGIRQLPITSQKVKNEKLNLLTELVSAYFFFIKSIELFTNNELPQTCEAKFASKPSDTLGLTDDFVLRLSGGSLLAEAPFPSEYKGKGASASREVRGRGG